MKKIILSMLAILVFGFANAQKTRFGVKGGLNVSSFTGGDYYDDSKSLIGFHVGGFAEIKVIERLAIQPELLFSTQGAKLKYIGDSDIDNKLSYLNVPVLAKFFITKEFTVEAGPQVGFLLSAKYDSEDAKDDFKSVDFGFNFGVGYSFTDNLGVNLRYTVGLANIADYETDNVEDFLDSPKNSNLALSLAYKF
ncbi:PorT family protein [Flavobacterium circumlabens]|uniref:Outer membrane protein with beta-barrel domain n=1 Tax=Flavobacterium circumlabens TaxID=2133765 RepID=A0A4Y7UAW9_9FLAO|nr:MULTISPECIES: porin family protein [Flavobacterium]QSB28140.1 PorT family protein [Flavobacterium sp. CLA17]TCN56571.1 outer membrane protein with beta-barrel domain [Flavobacterium circumlabens]TEB43586.1 PorT family protein [Flavobacterium circumlabens]